MYIFEWRMLAGAIYKGGEEGRFWHLIFCCYNTGVPFLVIPSWERLSSSVSIYLVTQIKTQYEILFLLKVVVVSEVGRNISNIITIVFFIALPICHLLQFLTLVL